MKRLSRMTFSLLVLGFGLLATPAVPADMFLKIDGYTGTSTARDTQGAIIVDSINASVTSQTPEATGPGRAKPAGRAEFSPLTFTKTIDQNSPRFALAAADGRRLPTVTFEFRMVGERGESTKVYEIILTNAYVSSYSVSAAPDINSIPREEVALRYDAIEWKFFPRSADGRTPVRETTASFDIGKGTGSESNGADGSGSTSGNRPARR